MKKKHTYESMAVEAVDVAALVAAMVVACVAPGALVPSLCIVALDVAKQKFFAALSTASGEVQRIVRFEHPTQTLAMLKLLMELQKAKLDVQVVLEPTGTYGDAVRHQCHEHGLKVYEVLPKKTHDMAEVIDGVPSMHDAKATVVLAQLHALGKSRQWVPPKAERRKLRAILDHRVLFSEPLEQHYGRLEALLARYWPEFWQVMDVRNSRSWMSLLSEFPGPEAVAKNCEQAKEVLRTAAHGRLPKDRITEIVGASKGSLGLPMTKDERVLFAGLVTEIQRLTEKLDQVDKLIAAHVDADPVMQALASVVGPAAAAALVTYVGAPNQYESAGAYEKACGLNLKVRSSGKNAGRLMITKRGSPRVRQLLYLAALRLCKSDSVACAWYQQRGCYKGSKKKAAIAVVRKLVRALWSIGRDPEHLAEFDSHKLFDVRRLRIQSKSISQKADSAQAVGSPGQTAQRHGCVPRSRKPSTIEVHA